MRVVNGNFETITEYDLTAGKLISSFAVKEDAEPIDNVNKFAWANEDWEKVLMYIPNPVKTPAEEIAELKQQLESTDYKVIKCSECQLLGKDLPYDVEELHTERQAIRSKINELEATLTTT